MIVFSKQPLLFKAPIHTEQSEISASPEVISIKKPAAFAVPLPSLRKEKHQKRRKRLNADGKALQKPSKKRKKEISKAVNEKTNEEVEGAMGIDPCHRFTPATRVASAAIVALKPDVADTSTE